MVNLVTFADTADSSVSKIHEAIFGENNFFNDFVHNFPSNYIIVGISGLYILYIISLTLNQFFKK